MFRFSRSLVVLALAAVLAAPAHAAQDQRPITLDVDAREAPTGILRARMTLPVAAGPLTLRYPQWIPGEHGPTGPINSLTGFFRGFDADAIAAATPSIRKNPQYRQAATFQGARSMRFNVMFTF